jgi:hypothetical protein
MLRVPLNILRERRNHERFRVLAELVAQGRDPRSGSECKPGVAESNQRRAKYLTAEDIRVATNEKACRYRERKRAG